MFEDGSRIYGVKEFSSEAVMTITYTRCDLRSNSSTLKEEVQVKYSPSLSRDRSNSGGTYVLCIDAHLCTEKIDYKTGTLFRYSESIGAFNVGIGFFSIRSAE